jgi:hypothetical protein
MRLSPRDCGCWVTAVAQSSSGAGEAAKVVLARQRPDRMLAGHGQLETPSPPCRRFQSIVHSSAILPSPSRIWQKTPITNLL